MNFRSPLAAAAAFLVLAGCLGGEPLAPGEQSLLLGVPRSADCQFSGPDITVSGNQNIMGKGISARGAVDQSVLICTNAAGQRLRTTDHRDLLARAPSAIASLYTVELGENTVSGTQTIGTSTYEFWGDFVFVPLGS
ncbi:MAG: hypothetical protein GVY31_01075 [Alphaproteobacteria bacterium]|nr:hypothetical protein [Alphaproteobacteria bacterium]